MSERDPIARYLDKRADLKTRPLVSGTLEGIEQVVAIPVLAERGRIEATLASLAANPASEMERSLVVCVVNNRADVEPDVREENRETLAFLHDLMRPGTEPGLEGLRVAYVDAASEGCELGPREGVGTARKLGLDWGVEALRRAGGTGNVLICLDADTLVSPDYLESIRAHYESGDPWAAVIDFEHQMDDTTPAESDAIVRYEIFLRYHVLGLEYARSPYAFHTVGSTMTCTAEAYAAVGGMNRRQAGEDFYFLQELAKTGRVERIRSTTVRPSARASWRVPFGTGRWVGRYLAGEQDDCVAYHPECYTVLRGWLELATEAGDMDGVALVDAAGAIDAELAVFLRAEGFAEVWPKLQSHAADHAALARQFHRWFDGLKTLRLIHHLRDTGRPNLELFAAVGTLLEMAGKPLTDGLPGQGEADAFGGALLGALREEC